MLILNLCINFHALVPRSSHSVIEMLSGNTLQDKVLGFKGRIGTLWKFQAIFWGFMFRWGLVSVWTVCHVVRR